MPYFIDSRNVLFFRKNVAFLSLVCIFGPLSAHRFAYFVQMLIEKKGQIDFLSPSQRLF